MNFVKHCSRAITAYQQQHSCYKYPSLLRSSLYSTSYHLNPPQITNIPRTRKSREPSSSSFRSTSSRKIKQEAEEFNWPRPCEIPYQAKVANLVNLIGYIKLPVKLQSFQDGKYRAITFISQEFGEKVFSIPIMFEDDLARIVACHLKKNDSVHVEGQLSEDPIPFDLKENRSNYHVVVQDIKFVAGIDKKNIKSVVEGDIFPDSVDDGELVRHDAINSHTMKDGDNDSDSWLDFVKNSMQWLDFREMKSKGSLPPNFPDFKHKDVGTPLWLTSAPKWVLSVLENLEFCVYVPKQNIRKHRKDEVWKSLVENPSAWWDNRLGKKYEKGPDFKHKKTGEVLWLDSSPDWVVSKLPPPIQKQSVDAA